MNNQDLCKWLRNNSSGAYRPSAEAANRIEEMQVLLERIKRDLLLRGETDSEGVTAVNLSSGLWLRLKELLEIKNDSN